MARGLLLGQRGVVKAMSEAQRKARGENWTPSYEVILDALTYPRDRLGEPLNMTKEQFDRFLNHERAEAIRDVSTGFIDWDILYGHSPETEDYREAMKTVAYLGRRADEIENKGLRDE